jgi:hypothetical protein
MSDIQVEFALNEGRDKFRPGETVCGTLTVTFTSSWTCDYIDVVAGWRTSGRGDQDHDSEATVRLAQPGEPVPPVFERRFSITLPPMPWTYYGVALKINWTVGAYLRPERGREQSHSIPIIVHPTPGSVPRAAAWHAGDDDEPVDDVPAGSPTPEGDGRDR